ncbi:MAG: CocE/NonD family hydrolase [Chloroflexi bacterium]|nr:CocE/NonD family hydrolase [Chloroflexota bacterium]
MQILKLLEPFDLSDLGPAHPDYLHLAIEACKVVWQDRFETVGDPASMPIPQEELLSENHILMLREKLRRALEGLQGLHVARPGSSGAGAPNTAHLLAVDGEGNLASMTLTHAMAFGSLAVVPGTGIVLNGGMCAYDPHPGPPNSVGPWKRPAQRMSPMVASRAGMPALAIGSPYVKALVPSAHQEDNFGHIYSNGVLQLQNAINFGWIGQRTVHSYLGLSFGVDLRAGPTPRPQTAQLVDPYTLYWRLPLISALDDLSDAPIYRHFLSHPTFDDYWKSYSMKNKYAEVDVPALFIAGWYDNLIHEVLKCFVGWKSQARTAAVRAQTRILIGPWHHRGFGSAAPNGDLDFGPAAAVDLGAVHLRWYDRRLKGIDNGIDQEAAIRLFVMGANVWRDEHEWPLARTQFTPYYLHSRGRANSLFGDGELSTTPPTDEPADSFTYDPANPVPTLGGPNFVLPETIGARDRRPVERRDDVLVYTTAPLAEDVEVTGPIDLNLYAASSVPDTDFTATLVDVHPDGRAIILCDGIVRARARESLEEPTSIDPGKVYAYRIPLWETSNVFKAGHRIRVEISSSNFPRFCRNLNTGEDFATGTRMAIAHQTVLHDARSPSHVVLPVIPA